MNTTARSYYLCPLAAGEDNVTLFTFHLFQRFSGWRTLFQPFIKPSDQYRRVIMVIMLAVASCAVAASTYIASE